MLHDLFFRVRSLLRRNAMETELEEELRFHREQQLEKYVKSGLTEREARRRVGVSVIPKYQNCRASQASGGIRHPNHQPTGWNISPHRL